MSTYLARFVGVYLGAIFGVLLAWFAVDWPEPLPTVPRLIGWVFFVSLGAFGGYAIAETKP